MTFAWLPAIVMLIMSFFSQTIARYYKIKRWQIVFSNGMNLRQMSEEMEERLSYAFSSSQCSRILKGFQIPSHKELNVLSDMLGLSGGEREQLYRAVAKDCLAKHSLHTDLMHKKHRYTKFLEYVLYFRPLVFSLSDETTHRELDFPISIISRIQMRLDQQYRRLTDVMTGVLLNPSTKNAQWFLVDHSSYSGEKRGE